MTELDAIFAAHDDDELLYTKVFPKLRNGAVRPYHKFVKDRFYERVSVFDAFVEGSSLPFDYTDEVADLYEKIFDLTDDAAIKKLLLARVLSMAASYNRYHVGDVLGGMLEAIDSPDDALIARDVLRNDISSSNWFAEYKSGLDAVPVISETLAWCKEQQKKRETDEF